MFIRTSVPSSAATNGCGYWCDSSMVGKDSWDLGAAWCCLRLTCDSCVLYCYFYRAILVECVAMGTGASRSCEWSRGPRVVHWDRPCRTQPRALRAVLPGSWVGPGQQQWWESARGWWQGWAVPAVTHWEGRGTPVPCPCCRAHGAVPTGLCPWCHPGVPPSEHTPTHPGLTGTGAGGLLARGTVFCHPITRPFPGPFLIWAARQ